MHSVKDPCEELFPGHGAQLTILWRTKQLEYTWLRSLMGRYEDFGQITRDALVFACGTLDLSHSPDQIDRLMHAYGNLRPIPGHGQGSGRPGGNSVCHPIERVAGDAAECRPQCRFREQIPACSERGRRKSLQAAPCRCTNWRCPAWAWNRTRSSSFRPTAGMWPGQRRLAFRRGG